MFRIWLPLLVLTLFALPVAGFGETRYVSDQLYISLRANPEPDAALITTLKTDTPLEILEEQGEFLRVRTPEGEEGYVLGRYLTSALPKPLQIERLQRERDALQQQVERLTAAREAGEEPVAALEDRVATLQGQLEEARSQLAAVRERYGKLQQEAADVVALVNDRDRLQAQSERLRTELDDLQEQNRDLLRTGMIRWFVAGAGVFFIGWLAGKLSRKKRRSF